MEPPSRQLQKRLTDLGLCQPADLRNARKRVKRLARDLPAFDSVWIDALLHNRKLTTFQAKQLESTNPQRLQVKSYLLVEPLGSRQPRSSHTSHTYLARKQNGKEIIVLKQIDIPEGETDDAQQKLQQLTDQFSEINTPFIISPLKVFEDLGQLVTISQRAGGAHLKELLIRRGRLTGEVVMSLCRQLAEGLYQLERRQLHHGDLQLKNIRLSETGQIAMVDAGVKQALSPQLMLRADCAPEEYDAIASELIGTGNVTTVASDMYAVGCLLWQLLAGRPPFPTGDPLSKLALHQTKRIIDVSEWAPETSAELVKLIQAMTSPSPTNRPSSWRDVLEKIGAPRHRDKKVLASFASQFLSQINNNPLTVSKPKRSFIQSKWGLMVLMLFVGTGGVLTLMDDGARAKTLSILSNALPTSSQTTKNILPQETTPEKKTVKNNKTKTVSSRWLPLPQPDSAGIIQLTEAGPYAAADISTVGPLRIRGLKGKQPRIIVENKPCKIWAEQLILENVHFEHAATSGKPLVALLLVQSQDMAMFGCSFQSRETSATNQQLAQPLSVAWRPIEPNDNGSRRIIVERTIFANGSALFLQSPPKSFKAKNCLKRGNGSFIVTGEPAKKGTVTQYQLTQITLRNATALLETQFTTGTKNIGQTIIEVNQSVFQLNKTTGALFQFTSQTNPKQWLEKYELTGEGTLAGNNLSIANWLETTTNKKTKLAAQHIPLEGLVGGSFEFVGDNIQQPAESVVKQWQAPLRSSQPPGIDATQLMLPNDGKAQY